MYIVKFARKLKFLLHNEKGQALILVAFFMFVLIGIAAITVDAGSLYKTRREMVNAADAAALAGAKAYLESEISGESDPSTDATNAATTYALNNGAESGLITPVIKTEVYNGASRMVIEVTAGKNNKYSFAKILGFSDKDVTAKATATWGFIKEINGGDVLPLFITDQYYALNANQPLHDGKIMIGSSYVGGNWGYFKIGQGNTWKDALKGASVDVNLSIDNTEEDLNGNKQALIGCIEERMDSTARGATSMTGFVPIIDYDSITVHGSTLTLPILFFAYYHIEDVIKSTGVGSTHADCDLTTETAAITYPGEAMGTIIGHFTDETAEIEEVVRPDDQINPNPGGDSPANYIKLID